MLTNWSLASRALTFSSVVSASLSAATAGAGVIPDAAIAAWARHDVMNEISGEIIYERVVSSDGQSRVTTISFLIDSNCSFIEERTADSATVFAQNYNYAFRAERIGRDSSYQLVQFGERGIEANKLRGQVHKRISFSCEPLLLAGTRVAGEPLLSIISRDSFRLFNFTQIGDDAIMCCQYDSDVSNEPTESEVRFSVGKDWSVRSFHSKSASTTSTGQVQYSPTTLGAMPQSYEVSQYDLTRGITTRRRFELIGEIAANDLPREKVNLARYGLSAPKLSLLRCGSPLRPWAIGVNCLCLIGGVILYFLPRAGIPNRGEPWWASSSTLSSQIAMLAFVFFTLSLAMASWKWFGPSSWGPRIECSPIIDLGRQTAGVRSTGTVTVSNTGRELLTIERIAASCGCMKPLVSEALIPPGYCLLIPLTINLDAPDDNLRKPLLIESNDPNRRQVTIQLFAHVVKDRAEH